MSKLYDIFSSMKDYFELQLSAANWVTLGYIDERADESTESNYPSCVITLYDTTYGNDRRNGGFIREMVSETGNDITFKKLPIPITYHFQADVVGDKLKTFWNLNEEVSKLLGDRYSSIILPSGEKLYLIPDTITSLPGVEGLSMHRTSYRFYTETWLSSPDQNYTISKVLRLDIQYKQDIPSNIVTVEGS